MRNKHVTRFGNPTTPIGAMYCVSDQEGLVQMAVDLALARMCLERDTITAREVSHIIGQVRREQLTHNRRLSEQGIPGDLRTLLQITKKSETKKFCRGLTISEFDLFLLIHNCDQMNFEHKSKFPEYVPSHLTITDADREKMKKGNVMPIAKKARPLLAERRHIHVHLFQRDTEWHCFYFRFEDVVHGDDNHWKHGCHLHYVSYLWPNFTKDQIWNSFDTRATDIPGNLHVRFAPFDFTEPDIASGSMPEKHRMQAPRVFVFGPSLISRRGSEPTPTAQVATRGLWTVKVSIPKQ